jgi:thiamine-phosphate pyrophosphorylase
MFPSSAPGWPRAPRGLYAIVDLDACRGRDPVWLAEQILDGGCAALQLRAKHQSDRRRLEVGQALRDRAWKRGVPFVVNDRVDLALLLEADALHLGQEDLSYDEVRRLAPKLPIGISTHRKSELEAALAHPLAYVAFGPVFTTASKARPDPVVGPARLADAVARAGDVPLVAIGGIRRENASEVAEAGAAMGAVIGELAAAQDPAKVARALHRLLGGGVLVGGAA